MQKSWFWNIELLQQTYLAQELKNGHLRQGWGYDPKLDLREIYKKVQSNDPLYDEERTAWDRCQAMLLYIEEGDLILVKNMPTSDCFTIVRVTGKYDFQIGRSEDHGHILPVSALKVYNKYSRLVPAPLTNAINREQNPIRITYKHDQTVKSLSESTVDSDDATLPEPFKDKVKGWRLKLLPSLVEALKATLTPSETERLVLEMLRRDGIDVLWNAGANERGADIIGDVRVGYGLGFKFAVQVKKHWGIDEDVTSIAQLEQAFEAHKINAALLVSVADHLGANVEKALRELQQRYKVEALYGIELYLRLLEFVADPNWEVA